MIIIIINGPFAFEIEIKTISEQFMPKLSIDSWNHLCK